MLRAGALWTAVGLSNFVWGVDAKTGDRQTNKKGIDGEDGRRY